MTGLKWLAGVSEGEGSRWLEIGGGVIEFRGVEGIWKILVMLDGAGM